MATSTKHNGFRRVIDRALSATLSNSFSTTDSELAILVNGQEALAFKPDSVGTYGMLKLGNQPAEALASVIDGYGVSLATGYSASATNRIYALEINADTGSTDLTGDTNLGAIKGRAVAGTTQTNCGISGIIGTLDVFTVDLQGNFNGVCGVLDFYGNCTLGTGATCYGAGLVSVVWNEATTTLGAGAVLSGIDLVENGAVGSFGTGSMNPAVNIRGNWREGINIGACTTGINVAANLVMPQFITIGTSANPMHWDGVANNWLIHTENTDVTPPSVTCYKFVLTAAQSAAVTSGRLESLRAVVESYSTNNVTASMRALVGQVDFNGNCTYVGLDPQGCYGLIGSIWSGTNLTATGDVHPLGLFFGVETGSALNGESSFIYMYNYGKVEVSSVMQVYNAVNLSGVTYLLDMQAGVLGSPNAKPCNTGDVNPSVAPDGDQLGADGHIKILVGATPYYIPIFGTLKS